MTKQFRSSPDWAAQLGDSALRIDAAPGAPRVLVPLAAGSVVALDLATGSIASRWEIDAAGVADAQWIARDASTFAALGWNGGASVVGAAGARAFEDQPPLELMAVAPTGEFVLAAGGANAGLWRHDGTLAIAFDAMPAAVSALAWNESADMFAAACLGAVHVWFVGSLTPHPSMKFQANASAAVISFAPGGRWLGSGGHDSVVRFHDLDGKANDLGAGPFRRRVRRLSWSARGRHLAIPNEREIVLVDMQRFSAVANAPDDEQAQKRMSESVSQLRPHLEVVAAFEFHPKHPWLAVASRDGEIRVTEIPTMIERGRMRLDGSAGIADLRWTADGASLLAAGEDGRVACWKSMAAR